MRWSDLNKIVIYGISAGCIATVLRVLVGIAFAGEVIVVEPNNYILYPEIAACTYGFIVFMVYGIRSARRLRIYPEESKKYYSL